MEENFIEKPNNANIIRNISYDQNEILENILKLHVPEASVNENGEKYYECDITASKCLFYRREGELGSNRSSIPQPKYKMDVYPVHESITKIEPLGRIPLEDNSIESIMIDLPFVVSTGPSMGNGNKKSNIISNRFSAFYPVMDLYETYYWTISEAYRVLKENGVCVFKCQNTISASICHNTTHYSFMVAQHIGFVTEDSFCLAAKNRLIGKMQKQVHARNYTSTFFVFKKDVSKKYKKFNYFNLINEFSQKYNNLKHE